MSRITIRRAHALSPAQLRRAADKMAAKLNEAFDIEFAWEEDVLRFRHSSVQGQLAVRRREVVIEAQLSLVLALMQSSIEDSIHEYLDRIFSAARKAQPKKTAPKAKKPAKH